MSRITTLKNELKYHFTHFRTRETFLNLSLAFLFGFGFLALIFAYIEPINYTFFSLSIGGFLFFIFIEVFGSIIGYLYQNGMKQTLKTSLRTASLLVTLVLVGTYLIAGGVILFGFLAVSISSIVPQWLIPSIILFYVVGSFVWMGYGFSFIDGNSRIPPLGMYDTISSVLGE